MGEINSDIPKTKIAEDVRTSRDRECRVSIVNRSAGSIRLVEQACRSLSIVLQDMYQRTYILQYQPVILITGPFSAGSITLPCFSLYIGVYSKSSIFLCVIDARVKKMELDADRTRRSRFMERAQRTGASVAQVESFDALERWLLDYLQPETRHLKIILPEPTNLPAPYAQIITRLLERYPAQMETGKSVDQISRCDTGISIADGGVIETGSIVFAQNELENRLSGMLPPVQCVILPSNRIFTNLDELGRAIQRWQAGDRRYVSVVTGPSRSSDIERVLTIGVHGPKELQIVLGPAVKEE